MARKETEAIPLVYSSCRVHIHVVCGSVGSGIQRGRERDWQRCHGDSPSNHSQSVWYQLIDFYLGLPAVG